MTTLDTARKRFSARNYKNKEISDEVLSRILEAGRIAPTAANLQPCRVMVIKSKEALSKLNHGANTYNAPVALLVLSDTSRTWKRPFDGKLCTDIDASIITTHMMLQATDEGLGSVWICYFKKDVICQEFNLPDGIEPVNILALGYTDLKGDEKRFTDARISIDEFAKTI
ncbi:MAG: nitroreductase family protein [Succinivibrio sp.]